MGKVTFKEFLILESKNQYLITIENVLKKLIQEYGDVKDDVEELKEFKKEASAKFKKTLMNSINTVVKDQTYITDSELVDNIKTFLKLIDLDEKIITQYLEASLDQNKREKFESKLQSMVADGDNKSEKKEKSEKDEEETDEKIAQVAKDLARSGKGDSKLEKEVEDDVEDEKKQVKKEPKILLGIIKSEKGGEITRAILGETDLKKKDIEALEYEEDVLSAISNARDLKSVLDIDKRIKQLKGTVVYFYSPEKKDNDEDFWTIKKV